MGGVDQENSSTLLDEYESSWRPRLSGASLLAELDIEAETLRRSARALGDVYRGKVISEGYRFPFSRWSACVAVTMSGIASHEYREGTYWTYWWEAIGHDHPTQQDAHVWGGAFLAALKTHGLPEFSDQTMKYVGPILMHAGIPTFCLENYFWLLEHRQGRDPGLDADAFLAWATGRENRLRNLHMPTQRFVRYGTDHAMDVIDRSLELLDRLRAGDPDVEGLGLPVRHLREAQRLHADGRIGQRLADGVESARRAQRPRLTLDPFGQGVQVWLPPLGDGHDGTARWRITVDGVQNTVRSGSAWANSAPGAAFPVVKPSRFVQVALFASPLEYELRVVDPDHPLLIFTEGGEQVPDHLAVPPDAVWVLHPEEQELQADLPPRVLVEGVLPLGWDGWRLTQVSLEKATWVGLSGEGARRRAVRGHSKPRIGTEEPVPGVTTVHGTPVFAAPPVIWLPAEAATTWTVTVRTEGTGEPVFSGRFDVDEPTELSEQVWGEVPRPLLGGYEITVRGPIGRSSRRSAFVAEGLTARYTPQVRLFAPDGLTPGRAELHAASGLEVTPALREFSASEREQIVTCGGGERAVPLLVTPPAMRVLLEEEQSPRWSFGPFRLETEKFTDAGSLFVEIPGVDLRPPIEVRAGGRCVQELRPTGRGHYNLRQAVDTVAQHRNVALVLPLAGRLLPLGRVQPGRLASGVTYREGRLVFDGGWTEDLTAGVYQCVAPWREPVILAIEEDGSVPLPDGLHGPVHVRLAIDDPWVGTEWPRWPHPKELLTCEIPGWRTGVEDEEALLSGYLARRDPLPDEVERLDRLWAVVDLANRIDYPSAARRIEDCAVLLRRRPQEALRELADAPISPERKLVALVTTGLAVAANHEHREEDGLLWRRSPVLAAVLTGTSPDLHDDTSELHAEVVEVCGEAGSALLRGEGDPHAQDGRFDGFAEAMDRKSPEQIDYVWGFVRTVPGKMLDSDTRLIAARRLFDGRRSHDGRRLASHTGEVLREAMAIRVTEYRGLERYIQARCHPKSVSGWVALPAMSIACALIARIAARGHEGCRLLEQEFRPLWRTLAKLAPDLVGLDLVRAELLVADHRKT